MWDRLRETNFMKGVIYKKPYEHMGGSDESVDRWAQILKNLNENYGDVFAGMTVKKQQDKLRTLLKNRETVVKFLEKQSGIALPLDDPWCQVIDAIIVERKDCIEKLMTIKQEKKLSVEELEKEGEDCRMKAMETTSATRKRKADGDEKTPPRKERRTGSDTFAFMAARSEERKKERQEEIELRQRDLDQRQKQSEATNNAMLQMRQIMQQQQQKAARQALSLIHI